MDSGDRDDENDGLPKADVRAFLAEDARYTVPDAVHALDILDDRDQIYYINDQVRITPPDE